MNRILASIGCRAAVACGALFFCAELRGAAQDGVVLRGPYLQQGTPDSIVVRWRTSNATGGLVRYGTNLAELSSIVASGLTTNGHAVAITGLTPDTKYYYELGTGSTWIPGSTNQFFVTAPPVGTPKPTRLWVLGDSGEPGFEQDSVRDAYAAFARAAQRGTDLFLMLGDNAYDSGTDAEYQAGLFNAYPEVLRNTVLWPTVGNHDKDAAYYEIFSLPQNGEAGGVASGTESYYSFDYANIHFVCLNSYRGGRTNGGPMYQWLEADLQSHTAEWLIAFWHHPPYTKGTHDSDAETELIEMRQVFVPLLESHGVDLVLSGHSHSYERSYLIEGHYGLTTTFTTSMMKNPGSGREDTDGPYVKQAGDLHQGAVYTVAGNGSKSSEPDPQPAMFALSGEVGCLVIDIQGNRLDLKHLAGSSNVTDYFTLIKEPAATAQPDAPANLAATGIGTNQIQLVWDDVATNESTFRIERSLDGTNFAQVIVAAANATNATDSGLNPSTTYFYRARARNTAGHSDYSNVAEAGTLTPPPPPPDTTAPGAITNLAAVAATSNAIQLRWFAPGDDGHAGSAAAYELRFHSSPIGAANWLDATLFPAMPAPLPAGSTQSVTIAGLPALTLHYFAMRSRDESNNISPLSNLASGMTTSPTSPPAPPAIVGTLIVVPSNAVWRYLDTGSDQGTAWRGPDYNDGAWASGPAQIGYGNFDDVTECGFGPDEDNKFITTYFRRQFTVPDPSVYSALAVRVRRDDGVIVYLNGTEVFRDNLTNGPVNHLTRALTSVSGTNKTMFHPGPAFSPALLAAGQNVLAAEVHQRSPTSSQMSFNLELRASAAAPLVRIARTNNSVALHWNGHPGQRYRVQRAATLPGTSWIQVGGEVVATNTNVQLTDTFSQGMRFYRVLLVQ